MKIIENNHLKKLGHLMLDLETMGDKSNSVIVSIGAVEFDIETGETGREFYQRIDMQSCLDVGLKINASTILWWMQQNDSARKEICKSGKDIRTVLHNLQLFMGLLGDFEMWGNGSRFDIGIIEDAYVACGYNKMPWDFRLERDVRTLVSFAPNIKNHYPTTHLQHHPIGDCIYQIGYCTAIWQKLKINIDD